MKYYKIKKRYAFTLLEILVALSIIVLILSSVFGSYKAATSLISNYGTKSILEQKARLFLFRLTSELRCSYAWRLDQTALNQSGSGSAQSLFLNAAGKELQNEAFQRQSQALFTGGEAHAGQIFLRFVTTSFASNLNQNMGGLAIVCYKFDDSGKVLLRSIRKYTEITEDNEKNLQWSVILSNVKAISCEYLKDEKWQKEWDSKEIRSLPQAVKITLAMEANETGPLFFDSCAYIMCSEPETNQAVYDMNDAVSVLIEKNDKNFDKTKKKS
jgi:type II secretion system protein J